MIFLKEVGFEKYGKPDVHIKEIFYTLDLIKHYDSDYHVLKAIVKISENVGKTAYEIDKIFWLIGSCYFYKYPHIGNDGKTGSMKKDFTEHWRSANQCL
ncbi:hypothetical protein [Sphaerochaeta sp.]|uniref:hypothetical protein n=1 Tax=Sphaerochaeta sp. TaxID=1972642 RepID=UPI003D0D5C85